MARIHQTAICLLLFGIIGVYSYPPEIIEDESENLPLSSSIDQLISVGEEEKPPVPNTVYGRETETLPYPSSRVKRNKLTSEEQRKAQDERRDARLQVLQVAWEAENRRRVRALNRFAENYEATGLTRAAALSRARMEHPELAEITFEQWSRQ